MCAKQNRECIAASCQAQGPGPRPSPDVMRLSPVANHGAKDVGVRVVAFELGVAATGCAMVGWKEGGG